MMTIEQALAAAIAHHQAARLSEAAAIYRRILEVKADHPDALHLLGVATRDGGDANGALAPLRRAVAVAPGFPQLHHNLGLAFERCGRRDEAAASFGRAAALQPDSPGAVLKQADCLRGLGRHQEAVEVLRNAVRHQPDQLDLLFHLTAAAWETGRLDLAEAAMRHAVRLHPENAEAHGNLKAVLNRLGRFAEAAEHAAKVAELKNRFADGPLIRDSIEQAAAARLPGVRIERWLSEEGIKATEYAGYWNNEAEEAGKEWNVADGNFAKVEAHLAETGLVEDFRACVAVCRSRLGREIGGRVIDVAAGTLWLAQHLFRDGKPEHLVCLEYSVHRLLALGPRMLAHYGIPGDKVTLALGSFYDIRLPDASLDVATLAQALHHADHPRRLLRELHRVLKPGGLVVVLGEHFLPRPWTVRDDVLFRRAHGRFARSAELFPCDIVMGDHYYLERDYTKMFRRTGFDVIRVPRDGTKHRSYLLVKRSPEGDSQG